MWNLTPEYIQQAKEELKGRRAAIQARYEHEVKSVDDDLKDIEELERIAYAFAAKHLPVESSSIATLQVETANLAGERSPKVSKVAEDAGAEPESTLEPEIADQGNEGDLMQPVDGKRLSLWRGRKTTEAESL